MAKRKPAPADADTPTDPTAAWPFPTTSRRAADVSDATPKGELPAGAAPVPAAARIRVDEVQLYTDPAQNTVAVIALEQLVESPFNPRTRFAGLAEMAETMKAVGVMQPILARPVTLPGEFQIARGGTPLQAYEIVYGHRRCRAAKLAALAGVPAIVRTLTDAQAAQLQAIENVQRKDLDPLEEALGYKHYCETHQVTKDQLAAEVGLSRSHVYARLKLLNAVSVVQDALRAGEIGSEVALLVARIHTPKLQEKALAAIKSRYYDMEDGGARSFRSIRELLREKFTLDLDEALFDPKAETLVEDAGSCTSCPKRTANAPEYSDLAQPHQSRRWVADPEDMAPGEPNLCTDPDCFEAKKKAHLAIEAAKLGAKGKTVITGGKARAAITAQGEVKGAYIALKDVKAELAKSGKKPGTDVAVVTIQNPRNGKTVEAVAVVDVKSAGVKVKDKPAGAGRYDYEADHKRRQEEDRKRETKAAEKTNVNVAIFAAVRQAAAGKPLSALALKWVAVAALEGVQHQQRGVIATAYGVKNIEALAKKIGQLPAERLTTLILDCALVDNVVVNPYREEKPDTLLEAAKYFAVDVDEIRTELAKKSADLKTQDLLPTHDEEETAEA